MLFAASGLIGRPVAVSDGRVGAVKDFLFDDRGWRIRWMVVDTGHWLPGRKVLIHPSAIAPIRLPPRPALPMLSFGESMEVSVNLSLNQVEASPDAAEDEPVTGQFEQRLYDYYGWDPFWGASSFGGEGVVADPSGAAAPGRSSRRARREPRSSSGRSASRQRRGDQRVFRSRDGRRDRLGRQCADRRRPLGRPLFRRSRRGTG